MPDEIQLNSSKEEGMSPPDAFDWYSALWELFSLPEAPFLIALLVSFIRTLLAWDVTWRRSILGSCSPTHQQKLNMLEGRALPGAFCFPRDVVGACAAARTELRDDPAQNYLHFISTAASLVLDQQLDKLQTFSA